MSQVLIVDDDLVSRKVVAKILNGKYSMDQVESGDQALEFLVENKPQVILLDVQMPGMNGYEVCEKLKSNPETEPIPVIFLSSHGSLRERILGYEAGADDYLVKPCEEDELLAKVSVALKIHQEHDELSSNLSEARETALAAMMSSSEMGHVVHFVQKAITTTTLSGLADEIIRVCADLRTDVVVMMLAAGDIFFFSSNGAVTPLEKEVVQMLKDDVRFHDFGCRTQINYENIALLVKNMPLEDRNQYGRLKDALPFVVDVASSRLKAIVTADGLESQTEKLVKSLKATKEVFGGISNSYVEYKEELTKKLQCMMDRMEKKIPTLGLEEDQEYYVMGTIQKTIDEVLDLTAMSQQHDKAFTNVTSLFEKLVNRQEKLMVQAKLFKPSGDDGTDMDVELF